MTDSNKLFPRFANHVAYRLANLTGAKLSFENEHHRTGCDVIFAGQYTPKLEMIYLPLNKKDHGCLKISFGGKYHEHVVTTLEDAWAAILTLTMDYGSGSGIFAPALSNPKASLSGTETPRAVRYRKPLEDRDTLAAADLYLIDCLINHYWDEFDVGRKGIRGRGCLGSGFVYLQADSNISGDIVRAEMIDVTTLQISREGFSNVYHFNTLSADLHEVIHAIEQTCKLAAANDAA